MSCQPLKRKLDARCSLFVLIYIMNYLDRNNVSAARLKGLQSNLNLTDTQYSTCLSILYIGYIWMQPRGSVENISLCLYDQSIWRMATLIRLMYQGILSLPCRLNDFNILISTKNLNSYSMGITGLYIRICNHSSHLSFGFVN